MLSALVMTVRFWRVVRRVATSVVVVPASRMMVSPSDTRLAARAPILRLFVHMHLVVQRKPMDLRAHRVQKGAAMFAGDMSFLFEPLQILTDRRFGHIEGDCKVAHAGRALFLDPFENAATTRLGQQPGHVLRYRCLR